jgi:hypothetical protein
MYTDMIFIYRRSIATSGGIDFARQLAERNSSTQPQKKFRSSAAPKGVKLPSGYTDRTQSRLGADEGEQDEDDKTKRVKALEEMMKLQQIDEETFVKLRDEILEGAGAKERAGLVKGLDWKLLERVRRGERVDVVGGEEGSGKDGREEGEEEKDESGEDVDNEFERLEEREFRAVEKEKIAKKGEMAPPSLIPGKKRNRDQILAEMKAARQAAKEAAQPSLGARFKKVGDLRVGPRIERDSKGREVLITVDEDGNQKRKVRKVQREAELEKGNGLLMPDKYAKPLGMEVPKVPRPTVEDEEDIDIFDDAGDDYNPLAGLEDDDESDAEDEEVSELLKRKKVEAEDEPEEKPSPRSMAPPPPPKQLPASRNYFGDSKVVHAEETGGLKAFSDPTILAALKRASNLNPISKAAESEEEAAKEVRRKKMLEQDDRDAEDMDMGFGSSRFADEEDFEEKKVKLSEWGGGDDDEEGGKGGGKSKRKRGPKKRKGDANNAADVMKVLERRKAADS